MDIETEVVVIPENNFSLFLRYDEPPIKDILLNQYEMSLLSHVLTHVACVELCFLYNAKHFMSKDFSLGIIYPRLIYKLLLSVFFFLFVSCVIS